MHPPPRSASGYSQCQEAVSCERFKVKTRHIWYGAWSINVMLMFVRGTVPG